MCPRGERCEQRERRREHTLGPGVALGHEHPIEAIALGLLSLLQELRGKLRRALRVRLGLFVWPPVGIGHVADENHSNE